MARISTVNKLSALLRRLNKQIKKPAYIDLAGTFKRNHLPQEYSSFLLKDGIITRVQGGSRGPASYVWNEPHKPTKDLAELLANRYTKQRRNEAYKRNNGMSRKTNEELLLEIRDMLIKVLKAQ